ncbi:MAG TPA: tRNA-ribosyltransferase [Methanoculleus sp.]|nr:tRNA-ribosyltransferase [Methanoculleus sp.]
MIQPPESGDIISGPSFYHPAFEAAHRFIIRQYVPPARDICIFLPCSMKKPYSQSPSHITFRGIISAVLPDDRYHVVVFGTCGVVPGELERMYPYSHYRFMLGRCGSERVRRDFLAIETGRLEAYLEKTAGTYKRRVAYCLGAFREAMRQASDRTGIEVVLCPSDATIEANSHPELRFGEGSLNMSAYCRELRSVLLRTR